MSLITFKLNTSAIPNFDRMSDLEKAFAKANSLFIVGPYSVSFEKAFQAFNSGFYKKQNRELLNRHHILSGSLPIVATVSGGTKVTEEELKFFCQSEAYSSIVNEVRNGCITIEKEDGSTYDADTLQSWSSEGGGGGGGSSDTINIVNESITDSSAAFSLDSSNYSVFTLGSDVTSFVITVPDNTKIYGCEIILDSNAAVPTITFVNSSGTEIEYDEKVPTYEAGSKYQCSVVNNKVSVALIVTNEG